jgi:thiol-disulfide isomerase/thioredoxin
MKKIILLSLLLAAAAPAGPLAGRRVASFTLSDATGKYYDVLDFRGKVLLIDVMKTDCPHCVTLTRNLERVKSKYGDKVAILSIVNPPDNPQTVAAYIARFKVTSPVLFDFSIATAALLRLGPQNPTVSLPTLLVVDANGTIRDDIVYSDAQKSVFEGDGLFAIIDRALAPKK